MIEADGLAVPENVKTLLDSGNDTFYRFGDDGYTEYFDVVGDKAYKAVPRDPRSIDLEAERRACKVVWENDGASFLDIGEDVVCLEFHTKMNAIDEDIINAFIKAPLLIKEKGFRGLVVANQADHFSVGGIGATERGIRQTYEELAAAHRDLREGATEVPSI